MGMLLNIGFILLVSPVEGQRELFRFTGCCRQSDSRHFAGGLHETILSLFLLSYFFTCQGQQLPPTVKMTPIKETNLVPVKLIVPDKFKEESGTTFGAECPGRIHRAGLLYRRVGQPRFFAWVQIACSMSRTRTAVNHSVAGPEP